jgi:hypothetical protein
MGEHARKGIRWHVRSKVAGLKQRAALTSESFALLTQNLSSVCQLLDTLLQKRVFCPINAAVGGGASAPLSLCVCCKGAFGVEI